MNKKILLLFILIIIAGTFVRFYRLSEIPPGAYIDEASYGYNAYSLFLTGKDEWGKSFPIFLRSFGTYPSPLYTYLLIIPVKFLGLSIFSIRLPVASLGILLIILTYFLIYFSAKPRPVKLALITSLIIALAPWSILYSRLAIENNLALTLILIGFLFSIFIQKKPWLFIVTSIFFAISAYAYAAERVMSIIFLIGVISWFRSILKNKKRILVLGVVIFIIIQLPQLILLNTGGAIRRYTQQNFLNHQFYINYGKYHNMLLGEQIYYIREFLSQYSAYFSPRNLFFDPDPQISRSMPDLSVFYLWMVIPFFMGIPVLWKKRNNYLFKLIIFMIITSPLPAAVTRDPFYTSRVLPFLWAISFVIGLGIINILEKPFQKPVKIVSFLVVLFLSLYSLYSSYFILLPHERSSEYGYQYQELSKILREYEDQNIVINTEKDFPTYIMLAFYKKYDPQKMQEQSTPRISGAYYTNTSFYSNYTLDNWEIRPIFWSDASLKQILVGSPVAISDKQVKDHRLKLLFTIKDLSGNIALRGFSTNPSKQ